MKKLNEINYRHLMSYLSTIFSWALFVLLMLLASFLLFYFVNVKIINRGVRNTPLSIYTIMSGSMIPTINVDDVIINVKIDDPKDVQIGDIITFISTNPLTKDVTITHRVEDVQIINGEYQFTTKGDNNKSKDSTPALWSKVIGRAVIKIPGVGKLQKFVASRFGWLLVVIVPALYIIIKDILKIFQIKNAMKSADEENVRLRKKEDDNLENNDIINNNVERKDG